MAETAAATMLEAEDDAPDLVASRRQTARDRMRAAFHEADVDALRIAFYMRVGALGLIAVWIAYLVGFPDALFFHVLLLTFILLGAAQYWAGRHARQGLLYALILADFAFLAFTTLTDNPMSALQFPPGIKVDQSRELYFFVLLAGVSACYDPRRVLWAGASAIFAWTMGFFWLANHPEAVHIFQAGFVADPGKWVEINADPNFVDFNRLYETVIVMAIVTAILAAAAKRAREVVFSQIAATRERANLARYFAPSMAEDLAQHDAPFDVVQAQNAAVLFADVVGFTAMASNEPPERVIGFLRALHRRLEAAIFEHGGTLDKFMGDGLMATFGTPRAGPDDASRAIAAARAIVQAEAEWNQERAAHGLPPVKLSVGVHYGRVVSGDIGSERRLEFATIGDAVNLASRLEEASRPLEAAVVISQDLATQAARETASDALLAGFEPRPSVPIPGHAPIDTLVLPR